MVRATYIDKNGLKKGAWTREEDDKLRAYMKRYGPGNWRQMPKFAGLTRCGKSCRLRWMNYLCPGLKHGNYSEEEEDLIIKMHEQLGNKWSEIAAKLPGRTDNDVKNYWHARLKKRIMDRDRNKYDDNDDLNEQSSHDQEPSQTEIRPTTEVAEAESVVANTHSQPILESSTLFPQKFPDDEFPLSSPDAAAQIRASASANWNAEGRSLTSFEEFIEDFWTTPFVPDNTYYNQDAYPSIFSWEESSVPPHDASCFDDSLDLFCQVMQEFPGSSS